MIAADAPPARDVGEAPAPRVGLGAVPAAKRGRLSALRRALRCYQWVKNILLCVPLVVSHRLFEGALLGKAACAFAAFSFAASAVYVVNDLFDLNSDRQHPKKRLRPFASGELSIPAGVLLAVVMFSAAGLVSALTMPPLFIAELGLYVVLTIVYSFYLKRVAVADLITLACLYTLRVVAGGAATGVEISTWLLGFSMFLFLCLAFAKRYAALNVLQMAVSQQAPGRAYHPGDKAWISSAGIASGYLSVLVLALYVSSREVVELYRHPQALWLICPPLLYWVSRIWFLAQRGKLDDDPIIFTMKDPVSYAVGAAVAAVMVAGL